MLTTLALVLIGTLAVSAALATAYFFQRARRREEAAPDPADTLVEMRALGQRIETLVGQQQLQGETARQQLAQKMDTVGQAVDQQRHGLAGLQNELRHEVRRRDAEMEDLRTQIASIQLTTRLDAPAPVLALPEAATEPLAETAAPEMLAEAPAPDMSAFETPTFETPAFETPTFETPTFEMPAFDASMGDGIATAFSDDGWDTGVAPMSTPSERPVFTDPFAAADLPADAAPALPVFEPVSPFAEPDPFATPETAANSEFEPFDFVPPPDDVPAPPSAAPAQRATVTFEDLTSAPAATPPMPPVSPSDTAWISRAGRADAVPTFVAPAFEMPAFEMPAVEAPAAPTFEMPVFSAPAFETPAFSAPSFESLAAPAGAAAGEAAGAAAPATPPVGADRLTRITSIDDDMESALYAAGITTLDEIARWGRSDARRISSEISVSEDTIMNQWIFEAQAALFQSYASTQQRS